MSTAATPAQNNPDVNRRRAVRYRLTVPVNITVLRAGVPHNIPGRALNVGELGMLAALAGELHPGDPVLVEFNIPESPTILQAKAMVRHQEQLQCGVEFVGLTLNQQALIRRWASSEAGIEISAAVGDSRNVSAEASAELGVPRRFKVSRRLFLLFFGALLLMGGLVWWQWHRVWQDIESRVPNASVSQASVRVTVPSDVMEGLAIHKVDPVYPDAARQANVHGVVVLDAVIGMDGTVTSLRPVSGPELLTAAAIDAVKWWRFQPYRIDGKPVEIETTITLDFRAD